MAKSSTSFSSENQANQGHRSRKSELYAGQIRAGEDFLATVSEAVLANLAAIALGTKQQTVVNLKTGELVQIPVDAKTQVEAGRYVIDRIFGRPERIEKHELGDDARGAFQVLLGAAAQAHWQRLQAPAAPAPLAIEAPVTEVPDRGPLRRSRGTKMPAGLKKVLVADA